MSPAVPDRGLAIDAVQISMVVSTTIAVTLRFIARGIAGSGYWWDDWAILAALPLSLGCNVANLVAVRNGLGKHVSATPNAAERYRHNLFADELMYNTCLAVIKWGVLLMYYRLFGVQRGFARILIVVGTLVAIWWIGTEFAIIFQCWPIDKAWNVDKPGHCINIEAFFLGQAIPNIVSDIVILLLPQPQVWKLEMSMRKKIALCGIFLLGSFTAVASLVRLNVIVHLTEEDMTWNYFQAAVWSALEPGVGIISACLPCLVPILRAVFGRRQKASNRESTKGSGSTSTRRQWWSVSEASDRKASKVTCSEDAESVVNPQSENMGYKASAFHREGDWAESPPGSDALALDVIHVQSEVECHSDRGSVRQQV